MLAAAALYRTPATSWTERPASATDRRSSYGALVEHELELRRVDSFARQRAQRSDHYCMAQWSGSLPYLLPRRQHITSFRRDVVLALEQDSHVVPGAIMLDLKTVATRPFKSAEVTQLAHHGSALC
jgi:hypothetical protein